MLLSPATVHGAKTAKQSIMLKDLLLAPVLHFHPNTKQLLQSCSKQKVPQKKDEKMRKKFELSKKKQQHSTLHRVEVA
jgi:hypothetical protein